MRRGRCFVLSTSQLHHINILGGGGGVKGLGVAGGDGNADNRGEQKTVVFSVFHR